MTGPAETGGPGRSLWLLVPRRFNGPSESGNGGWVAGSLAEHAVDADDAGARPAVTVTLRRPPPLESAMPLERDATGLRALHDGEVVAEAVAGGTGPGDEGPPALDPVDPGVARRAEGAYAGHVAHPLAHCVGCGTARAAGDGLRIFPGPVHGTPGQPGARVAATWTPHPSLAGPPDTDVTDDDPGTTSAAIAWTALDCVGGWSAGVSAEHVLVLGRMTCALDTLPRLGEEHVVVAELLGTEGRRSETLATLRGADGRVVGRARHTWVSVAPGRFS